MNSASMPTLGRLALISRRLSDYRLLFGLFLLVAGTSLWAAEPRVPLSVTQQVYIDAHPTISMCVDPDWLPFEAIDKNNQHVGIAADLITLVAAKTGLQIQLHPTSGWEQSLTASRNGDCVALSLLNQTPDREQWLIFTDPLLDDPNVLISREEHPFISDLAGLTDHTMALPRGTAMFELFARDFPNLTIIDTESESEAMQLVSDGKADLTLRSLVVAAHTIKQQGWYNLKISGQVPGYENRLRMGVLQSEHTLRDILNRGINAMTDQERQQVMNRYLSLQMVSEVVTDYTLAYGLGLLLAAVTGTSLFWARRLRALNRQLEVMAQTDALTRLPNRHGLNLTLEKDLRRAQRYRRPLTVILLDIDHFKHVNDQYGHLTGDKVLVRFGQLLQDNLREADAICRWGGEEFLIVCFETDLGQCRQLAERLLASIRRHRFPGQEHISASAGIAALEPADTVDTLVQRADEALYQAKHKGRDQACVARPTLPATDRGDRDRNDRDRDDRA
ncbi:diguanylate cyclase (GGDEF)-like protein [Oceanisphaera litoralis]|uniref:diguanylate cyclase n=1 Tax=Oceanisphaera litoralis TaxID=225144 RepID=UPI00195929C5|nr:diguanylate cyclase [Oceanisphaera litoralis]MBM7456124.1 diguanylate cyclase (GGDEF)-like protein [Oceanisphaera litoralis]